MDEPREKLWKATTVQLSKTGFTFSECYNHPGTVKICLFATVVYPGQRPSNILVVSYHTNITETVE